MVALKFEIVSGLKVDPEALARAEESCKAQRRISADPTLAVNDFVDSTWRNVDRISRGGAALRQAAQGSPTAGLRPDVSVQLCSTLELLSVIVGNHHVFRSRLCPAKANSPLVVDSDAVLSGTITAQFL